MQVHEDVHEDVDVDVDVDGLSEFEHPVVTSARMGSRDAIDQCVILAGGLGTRMYPRTETLPKYMLPVAGRPFADHQLSWLAGHGVARVVLCIGYLGEQISAHVGDGSAFGLSVDYVEDGPEQVGTAGALRRAAEAGVLAERFLVTYGDSYLPFDVASLARAHDANPYPATLSIFRNEGRWDVGNVIAERGRVTLYRKTSGGPTPEGLHWIDYGMAALDRDVVRDEVRASGADDLARVYEDLSRSGRLGAFEVGVRFYEVGSPQGLADLEAWLARGPDRDAS